jgi:hypothetical protein
MAITISGNGIVEGNLANGAVTNTKLAAGIDATKLADGTITNSELQYINSLSSNAQTQISGADGSGWVHLATASNSSQTEFTFISVLDSTYDMYAFVLREVQHNAPNGDLMFQVSANNGSSWGNVSYHHATRGHDTGGNVRQDNSTSDTSMIIAPDTAAIGNLGFNGVVYLNSLSTYASTHFHGMYRGQTAGATVYVVGCGIYGSGGLGAINAVKFKPSTSTFNGSIYCFGITKS